MKDLGWTAFFALLIGVLAIFYLGREKNDGAYLHDGYTDTEYSEENEPPSVSISEINEDNMDFYAKPSASARKKARESSAGTATSSSNSRTQSKSSEYKTAKATTTVYMPTASSASKREAARRLNEKAAAAEKQLQAEKKRKSPSFVAAEKKLKEALASEDFHAANKAADDMEKELGAAVEFTASKPGDKLPANPLYKKRN